MRTSIAIATALALSLPALSAGAEQRVSLRGVAEQAGYRYDRSPVEQTVVLVRAGIAVVLRPGDRVYQVNGSDEVANEAPSLERGDMYVTAQLAGHLEALARRSATQPAGAGQIAQAEAPAHGTISLEARQLQGAEAIDVEGSAPPNLPVTITLLATVSSDIPTIVVSRHDVATDVNGRFGAVIPIASAYERGTLLEVVATSATGVASASAHLVTGAPNNGVIVPLEQQPH